MSRATSTRSPTGSPASAPGPISPIAPTGWPSRRRWPSGPGQVEEKLSDALHERLTQRFVDRRTSVLMRDLGRKGAGEFPVIVDEQGEVTRRLLSRSAGWRASPSRSIPTARHADRKMLLATAERRLGGEYEKRAAALVADTRRPFHAAHRAGPAGRDALARPRGGAARAGQESAVAAGARSTGGSTDCRSAAATAVDRAARALGPPPGRAVARAAARGRGGGPGRRKAPAAVRSILAMLVDEGGIVAREAVATPLAALDREQRRAITRLGDPHRRARPVHARRAQARGEALAHARSAPPRPASRCPSCRRRIGVVLPAPARWRADLARPARLPAARAADAPGRHGRAARPPRPRGAGRQARSRWSTRRWPPRSASSRRRSRG